jgi:type I restriction enzyme M protein
LILPLIFTKRLCDLFDDELNRIAVEVGGRSKASKLAKRDKKLMRFYLPLEAQNADEPVWTVIRTLLEKIGEQLTTHLRSIAHENPAPYFGSRSVSGDDSGFGSKKPVAGDHLRSIL